MKNIKVICFTILVYSFNLHFVFSQCNSIEVSDRKVEGKIKSLKLIKYDLKLVGGKEQKEQKSIERLILSYNNLGYVVEEKNTFSGWQNFDEHTIYTYNDKQKLITKKELKKNNDIITMVDTVYISYDNQGNKDAELCTFRTLMDDFDDYYKIIYSYNAKDKLLSERKISSKGVKELDIKYDYYDNGNLKIMTKNGDEKTYFTYDGNNNILAKEKIMFNYTEKDEYAYDALNNLIMHKYYAGNVLRFNYSYEQYDNKCNILKMKFGDDELEYKYEYDLNGSWVSKKEYRNGMPIELTIREIIYY